MTIRISGLFTYPIKACAGLQHESIDLDARGPLLDRRWMVVSDADETYGRFLTQREHPRLALVRPALDGDALHITVPDRGNAFISLSIPDDMPTFPVIIWRDTAQAWDEGDGIAELLSDFLDAPVRLVRMTESHYRRVDPEYSEQTAQVGFADAYPILVTNEASLADLNDRLNARGVDALPMNRFRPNVVVSGAPAWDEDAWAEFSIGGIALEGVKLCARCAVTTVDQATGTRPVITEPTATLATFRKRGRGVMFGQNVVHRSMGMLRVGDAVTITARYETEAP